MERAWGYANDICIGTVKKDRIGGVGGWLQIISELVY